MKLPRRKFLHLAAGAAALPAISRMSWAQAYPARNAVDGRGASARSEARRSSVSEKMAAFAEAQTSATTVSINDGNDPKVGKTVSSVYL